MTRTCIRPLALLALPLTLLASCTFVWDTDSKQRHELGVEAMGASDSPAQRDTIGAATYYEGMRTLSVRGFGVAVGLGQAGTTTCPKAVFDGLVQKLYKLQELKTEIVGAPNLTPEELIRSPDTAVVLVQGEVPPGAPAGTRFDIRVSVVPGTETRSLYGARLYTTELETYRVVGPQSSISGKTIAKAAGPVFVNPFSDEDAATQANPKQGVILSGGVVTKDRDLRLVLVQPSYAMARRIRDRINDYFSGTGERVADATSPSYVHLTVPEKYREDLAHFLGLVRALYLRQDPTFEATRARELAAALERGSTQNAQIALCWEGLGQSAIPVLDDLYASTNPDVSFFAAVAGLRLGEYLACETMIRHAEDPESVHRFQAMRALARAPRMAAARQALRRLLDSDDPRVQVAAYESLILAHDRAVHTTVVGEDNFALDLVETTQRPFVYAKRTDERRLALFGLGIRCQPPVFYRAPDGVVTASADDGDEQLRVVRVIPTDGSLSPTLHVPLDLEKLVRVLGSDPLMDGDEVLGLGLDYGAVVRLVYNLCEDGSISAPFRLEQPNAREMFGPPTPDRRPESEL